MSRRIRIRIGEEAFMAELNASRTAQAIWGALPLEGEGSFWGKEIYFTIPVHVEEEHPSDVVEPGTLAYWPMGSGFCIFWGPTPASHGDECRPYSPVNVFGRILGDLESLDQLQEVRVLVERLE